jgi:hypothetical protein
MVSKYHVSPLQRSHDTDGNGFLSGTQVHGALYFAGCNEVDETFFTLPNKQHLPIKQKQKIFRVHHDLRLQVLFDRSLC